MYLPLPILVPAHVEVQASEDASGDATEEKKRRKNQKKTTKKDYQKAESSMPIVIRNRGCLSLPSSAERFGQAVRLSPSLLFLFLLTSGLQR